MGIVAALLAALAGCTSQTASDGKTRTGSQTGFFGGQSLTRVPASERRPAPVASGPSLDAASTTVSTADYAGKVIVINVWGSWCAPEVSGSSALRPTHRLKVDRNRGSPWPL